MPPLPLVALALACPLLLDGPPATGATEALFGLALALTVVSLRWKTLRPAGLLILLTAYACGTLDQALALRIDAQQDLHTVSGEVDSLPEWRDATLRFQLVAESGPWGPGERRLDVRWYEAPEVPRPGEIWRFDLALSPVRGRVNFQGYDAERYAMARGVHGIGRVRDHAATRLQDHQQAGAVLPKLQAIRWAVRERLEAELHGLPGAGLVQALAIGDRSGLSDELRTDLQATGTGHLLAISGLHVGLVALFALGLARVLLALTPWRGTSWPARRIAPLLGLTMAAIYAGLAGFATSPRRALVMLAAWMIVLVLRRSGSAWRGWWMALVVVLFLDPLAPLSPGFWLSFGAVAVLMLAFLGVQPRPRGMRGLVHAQTVLLPGMLTLGIGWFGTVSLGGWFVNLLAIPWVSFVTLPLVLLTLLVLPLDGLLPSVLAHMAERSASWLAQALAEAREGLAGMQWTPPEPAAGTLLLAAMGGLLCLAPGALRVRRFGLAFMLPLVLPTQNLPPGALRIDALDVGQGQATWVFTATHSMLVDAGPGIPGRWSLVDDTVLPALRRLGRDRPDLILVSHGDLDHAGGLEDAREHWPGTPITGNWRSAPEGATPCHDQRAWHWDRVGFRVLHPSPWLPYLGNDSSCVLRLAAPGGHVLLPGDMGKSVEEHLAKRVESNHRLVLAPHHGSRTSSSDRFLAWANPDAVILSVGYGNRFGLPHEEVLNRYAQRGIPVWTTADCGALTVILWPDGRLEARSARRAKPGPWRFPAATNCP